MPTASAMSTIDVRAIPLSKKSCVAAAMICVRRSGGAGDTSCTVGTLRREVATRPVTTPPGSAVPADSGDPLADRGDHGAVELVDKIGGVGHPDRVGPVLDDPGGTLGDVVGVELGHLADEDPLVLREGLVDPLGELRPDL